VFILSSLFSDVASEGGGGSERNRGSRGGGRGSLRWRGS